MRSTIVLAALFAVACSHPIKIQDPFRNADGTLNVAEILKAGTAVLALDCSIPGTVTQDICAIGTPAFTAAQAAADKNPAVAASAAAQSLQATLSALPADKQPQAAPYFQKVITLLGGLK